MLTVDPNDVTHFDRTKAELETFLLFAILVAGKKASMQAKKLDEFLSEYLQDGETPFDAMRRLLLTDTFSEAIRKHRLGQYTKLESCIPYMVQSKLDLSNCTVDELESIPYVSMKTSRFFLLHSRKNVEHAALDVHILRYMREKMGIDTPRQTPASKKKYKELESKFLDHCRAHGLTPSDFDLAIWIEGSSKAESKNGK